MNNIEIIGIDHGWSQMKTSNTCFNTSIKELANAPAFHDNVLEYDDRYFAVGEERLEVLDSKVENENFYLLTLVAIAKELEIRGKSEADVVLAVGLPLTRFSAERKPFIDYLSKNGDVVFGFEQKLYRIHILNVLVYPQCYAAVAGMLPTFGKKALVIDVGSWTVDSMLIVNKKPDNSRCDTQNEGLIKCMRAINRVAVQVKNRKIDEAEIQEYMKTGKTELPKDELNLADIGIGVNGDGETKTALFCVIPDSDKSYNFIIGMLYTQIFQELYYQADFNCGGRLPIHVTFMLDEFANVALPDDYCSLLSTMRSREISSIIIIQNFAQLKALFKDTWETIPGNCDTFIYLGGNEQSTHKYVSELLGKGTIDKKSSGETKGRQGSSSRNYDVLGRELFTPDEVRKLDNKKCIIFIRGFDPIMDNKYIPFAHPMFKQTADGGGKPYVHHMSSNNEVVGPPYEILSQKALEHYKQLKEKGENVYIDKLTYEEFMMIGDKELGWRFQMLDEQEQKDRFNAEQGQELEYSEESETTDKRKELPKIDGKDTILRRMAQWEFSDEQQEEAQKAMIVGVPENKILEYFYPDVEVEEMIQVREDYEKASA